jgi:hypothetical protein
MRTGAGYDIQNKEHKDLILVYLLILIIHVTKHASIKECACDNERGVP